MPNKKKDYNVSGLFHINLKDVSPGKKEFSLVMKSKRTLEILEIFNV